MKTAKKPSGFCWRSDFTSGIIIAYFFSGCFPGGGCEVDICSITLIKSFISTSWWDLCTSSTDRAPPHGEEDEKEEEKKTVGSQARNLCVAPPLQGKPSRPATRHNGDLESVFDDSTLSELSEEDRRYTCSIYMLFNAASLQNIDFYQSQFCSSNIISITWPVQNLCP